MKISIITVTLNNKSGLLRAIESVRSQTYKNVEHIIVDGGSTDGTVEMLKEEVEKIGSYEDGKINLQSAPDWSDIKQDDKNLIKENKPKTNNQIPTTNYIIRTISEPDNGIYDAINKGIKLATGDVIGVLHSDDYYTDEYVLENYARAFFESQSTENENQIGDSKSLNSNNVVLQNSRNKSFYSNTINHNISAVYSDLIYVRRNGTIVRNWKTHSSSFITEKKLRKSILNGWMPPHPTLFLRKEVFEKYGLYNTDMKIAADYEMVLRLFFKYKITTHYLPITTYCMTIGGMSNKSLKNILRKSSEDYQAMKMHCIPFPLKTLFMKNIRKMPQFF